MEETIYTKNQKEFKAAYEKKLAGYVFHREVGNGKVEIIIACYQAAVRPIVESLPD